MAAKKAAPKPAISPERLEEIRASARSGANWASIVNYPPACECGLKTSERCHRHEQQ